MYYILPTGTDIVSVLHEHPFWYIADTDDMVTELVSTEAVIDAVNSGIHIENIVKDPGSHDMSVILRHLRAFESYNIRFNFVFGTCADGYFYEEDGITYKISAQVIRTSWGIGDQSFSKILRNSICKGFRLICTVSILKNKFALIFDRESNNFMINDIVVVTLSDKFVRYAPKVLAFVKFFNWYILVLRLDTLVAEHILFVFGLDGNFEGAYSYGVRARCLLQASSLFISKLLLTTK